MSRYAILKGDKSWSFEDKVKLNKNPLTDESQFIPMRNILTPRTQMYKIIVSYDFQPHVPWCFASAALISFKFHMCHYISRSSIDVCFFPHYLSAYKDDCLQNVLVTTLFSPFFIFINQSPYVAISYLGLLTT